MESVTEVDPLTEFFDAIRNPLTRDRYEKRLALFFNWLKLEGNLKGQAKIFASQAQHDLKWAAIQINDYMRFQRQRSESGEISESTVPQFYKPIKLFCEQNDIILNWKKIARRIPKGRRYANDRAPTRQEILFLVRYHDPRIKPIVLPMVSGGFRVGAWDYLKVKHLKPIEKNGSLIAGKLSIYAGTDEEYTTFITPEAYRALKTWLDSRKQAGEKLTEDSWLMRDLWDDSKYKGMTIARRGLATAPQKLTSTGVRRLMERALVAQGIRTKLEEGKRRYEFQADHGFRKFFNTVCDRHMKTLYVEFLMGHNTGLKESYNRAQEGELLSEYLKAAPELTILEATPEQVSLSEEANTRIQDLETRLAQTERKLQAQEGKDKEVGQPAVETLNLIIDAFKSDPKEWNKFKQRLDDYRDQRLREEYTEAQIAQEDEDSNRRA